VGVTKLKGLILESLLPTCLLLLTAVDVSVSNSVDSYLLPSWMAAMTNLVFRLNRVTGRSPICFVTSRIFDSSTYLPTASREGCRRGCMGGGTCSSLV
jgi:hypothetical protein